MLEVRSAPRDNVASPRAAPSWGGDSARTETFEKPKGDGEAMKALQGSSFREEYIRG